VPDALRRSISTALAPSCGNWSQEKAQLEAACALSGKSAHSLIPNNLHVVLGLLTLSGFGLKACPIEAAVVVRRVPDECPASIAQVMRAPHSKSDALELWLPLI